MYNSVLGSEAAQNIWQKFKNEEEIAEPGRKYGK